MLEYPPRVYKKWKVYRVMKDKDLECSLVGHTWEKEKRTREEGRYKDIFICNVCNKRVKVIAIYCKDLKLLNNCIPCKDAFQAKFDQGKYEVL